MVPTGRHRQAQLALWSGVVWAKAAFARVKGPPAFLWGIARRVWPPKHRGMALAGNGIQAFVVVRGGPGLAENHRVQRGCGNNASCGLCTGSTVMTTRPRPRWRLAPIR